MLCLRIRSFISPIVLWFNFPAPRRKVCWQRLITIDLDDLKQGELRHGALLTPQGKITIDFLLSRDDGQFRFDLDREQLGTFIKKMTLYRMRSDVTIEESSERVGVAFVGRC